MTGVPPGFRKRFADHNRSCWFAAAASLGGAWLSWLLVFALYTAAVLVFETVRTGNVDLERPPGWYFPVAVILAVLMLVATSVRRWVRRFRLPPDRAIIGWHLLPELLTLPASMTFAIWDHLGARVRFSSEEWEEAWRVLRVIFSRGRTDVSWLNLEMADGPSRRKILEALQISGLIDLHRGDDDWFYRVPTDQEPVVAEFEEEMSGDSDAGGEDRA